jgi:hypothetical protein
MKNIQNIADLQIHIRDLEFQKAEHEIYLHQKVESLKEKIALPLKFYKRITGMISGKPNSSKDGILDGDHKPDWINLLARVGIPFALNKLIFRKSGFIIKTLISLFSQSAITSVNKNNLASWVDKISGFIKSNTKKKRVLDYGIPPDSETY